MKGKSIFWMICFAAVILCGCAAAGDLPEAEDTAGITGEEVPDADVPDETPDAEASDEDILQDLETLPPKLEGAEAWMGQWIPEGAEPVMIEMEPYPELARAILEELVDEDEDPEKYLTTGYYYNYVDLNDDGRDEIFVILYGMYTSGSGGSSAMWILPDEEMRVGDHLSMIVPPVIVSDSMTNGMHDLIVLNTRTDNGMDYIRLVYENGTYDKYMGDDIQFLSDLAGITGYAIGFHPEMPGDFMTLADAAPE